MDVWKSAGDVVSHHGKNWVSIVTGDNKGNLPTNRSYWLKTSLAATVVNGIQAQHINQVIILAE